ncbi:hypothetical protein [Kitasatospora sp. MBT63]|uniref:hypothetical protein n=1 Tax=Kitasatospora sp. MBT63 TaxID=1444768 RepID=UPI0011EA66D8|nr:hypothetical protein [Kitasatospora sp. MBT63]
MDFGSFFSDLTTNVIGGLALLAIGVFIASLARKRRRANNALLQVKSRRQVPQDWEIALGSSGFLGQPVPESVSRGAPGPAGDPPYLELYNWFAQFSPYDVRRSTILLELQNISDEPIQITDIDIEKSVDGEPESIVSVRYPGGGAARVTAVAVDLDQDLPRPRQITFGDGPEAIEEKPYFENNMIVLAPSEVFSIKIVALAQRKRYTWSARLRISALTWPEDRWVPIPGGPFRTTGTPQHGYARAMLWAWFAGPSGAQFRDAPGLEPQ